jgi:hypothetical protein
MFIKILIKELCLFRLSQLKEKPPIRPRVKYSRYGDRISPNRKITGSRRKKLNKISKNKYRFFSFILNEPTTYGMLMNVSCLGELIPPAFLRKQEGGISSDK